MEFPYRESIGEVDPAIRQEYLELSIGAQKFIEHAREKTLEQLATEENPRNLTLPPIPIPFDGRPNPASSTIPRNGGPDEDFRYVEDPTNPDGVIDMLHFLESAQYPWGSGEPIGAAWEVVQGLKRERSAFEREDFKSNFLGAVFQNHYYRPEEGDLGEQFQTFFTDLERAKRNCPYL